MKYPRRKFIINSLLALMGTTVLPCCKKKDESGEDNTHSDEEIIVVGAGIAGLAAAKTLQNAGYKVKILEASERYGGRIKTIDIDGYKADAGASWIHGINGNPLYSLANENAITTKPTYYNPSYLFDVDGTEITEQEWQIAEQMLEKLVDLAYENPDISLQELIALLNDEISNLSEKMKRVFYGGVRSEIEIPYAVDANEIAAKALTTNDSFPGKDVIFPGGMASLTDVLAEKLNIEYNSFVTKIAVSGDKVNVYVKNPDDIDPKRSCHACHNNTNASQLDYDSVHTAGRVIVALPLGMLKNNNIIFEPALSQEKINAIDSLGIGTMNKVFLKFGETFWFDDGYFFQSLKEDYSKEIEFFSPVPTGMENVIVAVLAGAHARSIEKQDDVVVKNMVMDELRVMFGNNIPEPVAMGKTAWHTNRFSLGAYPHLLPGADLSACDVIAAPVENRIFFAGDATSSEYMATAHGAYLSGLDAAKKITRL